MTRFDIYRLRFVCAAAALILAGQAHAGITTTGGENIAAPSSVEEAEEWAERSEIYGTGLPEEHQPIFSADEDVCEFLDDALNIEIDSDDYTFDVLTSDFGAAILAQLQNTFGSQISQTGQFGLDINLSDELNIALYQLDYFVGTPEVVELGCEHDNNLWKSYIELEVPLTINDTLSSAKTGTLRIVGNIEVISQFYTSGLSAFKDLVCLNIDDKTVEIEGLDFVRRVAIRAAVPDYYCVGWDDVWLI